MSETIQPAPTPCKECFGQGTTSNHVSGEVECSSCEGTGEETSEPEQTIQPAPAEPYGYVLKTGHGNAFAENLNHVADEVKHYWKAVYLESSHSIQPAPSESTENATMLEAIRAMADEGWLMFGPEGMTPAQEKVVAILRGYCKKEVDV